MDDQREHQMHLMQGRCGGQEASKFPFGEGGVCTRKWRSPGYLVPEVSKKGHINFRLWLSFYVPNLSILAQSILNSGDPPSKQFWARAGPPVP